MEDTKTGWRLWYGLAIVGLIAGVASLVTNALWNEVPVVNTVMFVTAGVSMGFLGWSAARLRERERLEQWERMKDTATRLADYLEADKMVDVSDLPPGAEVTRRGSGEIIAEGALKWKDIGGKGAYIRELAEEFADAVGKEDMPLFEILTDAGYPQTQAMRMLTLFARDVRNPKTRAGKFLAKIQKPGNKYGIDVVVAWSPGYDLTAALEVLADYSHLETDNFAELFTTVEAANMLGAYMHHREKEGAPEAPAPEREVVGF